MIIKNVFKPKLSQFLKKEKGLYEGKIIEKMFLGVVKLE